MKTLRFLCLSLIYVLFFSLDVYAIKFAVFSDPHYYDLSLGTGKGLDEYISKDRKLIRESEAILKETLIRILEEKPQFVLIPGDLTKDGELTSHVKFANYLRELELAGIKVFVVPGNHDVNNPHAFSYIGNEIRRTATVSPSEFVNIYYEFGYDEAISRDPYSLSYVAEPVNGIWLFAIDSCIYDRNMELGYPVTGGIIKHETWDWIQSNVRQAKLKNKRMIAMLHHGVLEHYVGQARLFPEYLIKDWEKFYKLMAESGISVVFTGHYHSHDATMKRWTDPTFGYNAYIYDIETGSLVTYPSPYRIIEIDKHGIMWVKSSMIRNIEFNYGGRSFSDYSKEFLTVGLRKIAFDTITAPVDRGGYGLSPTDPTTSLIAEQITNAFIAHYYGDERIDTNTRSIINNLIAHPNPTVKMLGQSLLSLWTDLPPSDWTFAFRLSDGELLHRKRICSTLGNNPNKKRADVDTFEINLNSGDVIKITLEANTAGRFSPGLINVDIKSLIPKFNFRQSEVNNPSFSLTTEVKATGTYAISVSNAIGQAFSGDYCMTVETFEHGVNSLRTTKDVE